MAKTARTRPAKAPVRDIGATATSCDSGGHHASLVDRISEAVAQELDLIQSIVGGATVDDALRAETERRARTLAMLARTLSELSKMRADGEQRPAGDDDRPGDLDELRRRLSERLEKKLQGECAVPADGDVAGGDGLSE
jgi:hypothetical protein